MPTPRKPAYDSLEEGPGGTRWCNGQMMDREQYDMEGWHIDSEYRLDDGTTGYYWKARLDGLIRFGQLIHRRSEDRKSAWQARVDRDDEYSDSIQALIESRKGTA